MKALDIQNLLSEKGATEKLLNAISEMDLTGKLALTERLQFIEDEIQELKNQPDTLASVALIFNGTPVVGSRAIDTEFASKALETYQDIIAKKLAFSETGGLAERGRVPSKEASRLNITNVVHGSFGFILEEDDTSGIQLINSSLKEAVETVTSIVQKITDVDEEQYLETLDDLDPRLFNAFKHFIKNLYDYEASLKIIETSKEILLDEHAVNRGFDRVEKTTIEDEEKQIKGTLIGIIPFSRRFEAHVSETGEIIKGKIGPLLSAEYLERIKVNASNIVGAEHTMQVIIRKVKKPNSSFKISYTLSSIE